jgi:uncharacterized protein YndB with AHSA1/START domain
MTAATAGAARKAQVSAVDDRGISIERVFDASRDRVWKAMTDPKLLAQWWGRGHKLDVEKWEFRKGGHWRFVEHHDGRSDGFEGRFAEIDPPNKVVQTFEWDGMPGHAARQTMTLEDLGDGRTKLTSYSLFFTQFDRDGMLGSGMEGGVNESYVALDKLLASL